MRNNIDRNALILWGLILGIEILFLCFLNFNHLMPADMDGFQYFYTQYYFFNHEMIYQETPFWVPYVANGISSTWWFASIANLPFLFLTACSKTLGGVFMHTNFLHVFNAMMIFDEIILAFGTWLLCKRYGLSNLSCFYAASTLILSAVWSSQPWFNFHQYHMIPLVLFLGHRFLDEARWRYLFLAGNLLFLQVLGNSHYFIAFTTLTVFVYFVFWAMMRWDEVRKQIRLIPINCYTCLCLLGIAGSVYAAYAAVSQNTSELTILSPFRESNMTSSVENFLTYGRNTGIKKWFELLTGISPFVDMTLFIGYFPIFCLMLVVFKVRNSIAWVLGAVVLFLIVFGAATPLSELFFHIWPGMKYFRHLALTAPMIKLFLVLLSAFGLEALLQSSKEGASFVRLRNISIGIGVLFFLLSLFFLVLNHNPESARTLINKTTDIEVLNSVQDPSKVISGLSLYLSPEIVVQELPAHCLFWFLFSIMILCLGAVPMSARIWKALLIGMLVLHIVNLFHYKITQTKGRSISLSEETLPATYFTPVVYRNYRATTINLQEPRELIYESRLHIFSSLNMFFFWDTMGTLGRFDFWLKPLDQYLKAYAQPAVDSPGSLKEYQKHNMLVYPGDRSHSAIEKISGVQYPKIQVFKHIYRASDNQVIAALIADQNYAGDLLFTASNDENLPEWKGGALDASDRLDINYKMAFFNSNHLLVDVGVPSDLTDAWLHYADVWDPSWKAWVNGHPAKVYCSNLAYKAVQLNAGHNEVHFRYDPPVLKWIYLFWRMFSLFWIFYLGVLFVSVFRRPRLISDEKLEKDC